MIILMSTVFGLVGCNDQPQDIWVKLDQDCAQLRAIRKADQDHKRWQWEQIQRIPKGTRHGKPNKNQR